MFRETNLTQIQITADRILWPHTHVANIFQKLDVSGRTEAVTQALQIGIISLKSGRAGGAPFLQRADPPVPLLSRVDRLHCRFALFGFARLLPWP